MSKKMKTTVGVSVFIITLAIAAMAFAQGPHGSGRMMGYGGGNMMGSSGDGGCEYGQRGCGGRADLPDEIRAQVDEARELFFNETRDLRDDIQEARIALREAMTQDSPDESEVIQLQKNLSALKAAFDEKAVSHRLAMRKIVPEEYRGGGKGRGAGRGNGGGCWR